MKKGKCKACEMKEKYPVGKSVSIKTAGGGIPGIVYIKCPIHDKLK